MNDGEYAQKHVRFGWWSIAVFASMGLVLEGMHGFKVGAYLDVSNETRRLMWTLSHAHGTLLGLVHLVFASTLRGSRLPDPSGPSKMLVAASVCLPGGFFLGGVQFYAGDPGLGVLLVPIGAVVLIAAAVQVARAVAGAPSAGTEPSRQTERPRRESR